MAFDVEVENSYELSSGLVDEVTGVVRKALYTYKNEIGDGETCLLELMVEPTAESLGDIPEEFLDDGLYSLIFKAGKGMEPQDKGTRVAHESGRPKKFNNQSGMGLLLASALELDGVADALKTRGLASEAAIWEGLSFTFKTIDLEFTNSDDEVIKYTRDVVTAFQGAEDAKPAKATKAPSKAAAAKAKAAAAKAAAADDGDAELLHPNVTGDLREQLTAIAAAADDHDAFMEAAFSEAELDDAAEEAVADEAFFAQLKG